MENIKKPIYLDYHSTTPVDKRVAEKVMQYMINDFGNPGSVTHAYSEDATKAINEAKNQINELIKSHSSKIIFTSGATESINLSIIGTVTKDSSKKHKIAVLPVEHKAVLDTCKTLEKKNLVETIFLKVDQKGNLDLESLEDACKQELSLVCVMMANNEIGNIYPIKEICEIASKYNVPVLCDATQGTGKVDIDFNGWNISYMTISAHKMYGPKGSGALILKKGTKLSPMLCGGGQQEGMRPGTLNVSGIVGLGECCKIAHEEMEEDNKKIKARRDLLLNNLMENFSEIVINGNPDSKLCGNISVSFPQLKNDEIISLVRDKIAISTGSACSSGFENPSHVLKAMGLSNEIISSTLRICVGKYTTDEDIEIASEVIISAIKKLKEAK
ncbi:MAG: cysteine desulfurase family protein [Cyanobacteriota bacterium]